jgi:TolB-like protein
MSERNQLIPLSTSLKCKPSEAFPNVVPIESDVQRQLERIGASRFFCKSKQLRRFLSFAANHALFGEGQHLKESQVGVHVFDRGSAFDPRVDPIVRVEARRLRSKLESYYASVGCDDQLLIDFPKGTYTPVLRFRTARQNKFRLTNGSTIVVFPFTSLTDSLLDQSFGAGLTEELIHQLIQIPHLQVVFGHPETSSHDENLWYSSDVTKWNVRGSIRSANGIGRLIVQLIDTTSNTYVWSEAYERATGNVLAVQEGIAQEVVAKLKLTLGLIEPKAVTMAHRSAS